MRTACPDESQSSEARAGGSAFQGPKDSVIYRRFRAGIFKFLPTRGWVERHVSHAAGEWSNRCRSGAMAGSDQFGVWRNTAAMSRRRTSASPRRRSGRHAGCAETARSSSGKSASGRACWLCCARFQRASWPTSERFPWGTSKLPVQVPAPCAAQVS